VTPYRRQLALAILVWTLGALPLAAAAVQLVLVLAEPIHDFEAPGAIAVQLHEGDEKAILLQTRGSALGRFDSDAVRSSDLHCVARSDDGERVVRAHRIGIYTISHSTESPRSYVAKVGFTAPSSGRYRVRCDVANPALEHVPLGFSAQAHLTRVFLEAVGALAICAATIMAGVIIVRRARRARPPGPEAPIRP
jgi:hypothetical protein